MNEDVSALKRKPKHTKKHIMKDSSRCVVEKLWKFWTEAKFKLQTFESVEFLMDSIKPV